MDNDLIRGYLEFAEQSGLAVTTRYCRGLSLARLAAWLPVPLAEATPAMLARWRAGMQRRLNEQTILNYVTDARRFYAWLIDEGLAGGPNPAARIPVPRRRRRLPRPIRTEDLMHAITVAPDPLRCWLVLAAFAGLRCKEIALLRRECVLDTLRDPCLLIASEATKGGHEHIVPMAPFVVAELARAGMPGAGWMFARADRAPGPNAPHTVSARVSRHLRECGIAATCHQLRSWFGTQAYAVDHDLIAVANMMGHRDLESTRGYALVSQARAASIVAALPVPSQLAEAA